MVSKIKQYLTRAVIVAFLAGVLSSYLGGTVGLMASSGYEKSRTEPVFIYETLLNPITRAYACLCFTEATPATLSGFTETIRNITPAPSGTVRGAIIMVTTDELKRIDEYEGVPHDYIRTRVEVDRKVAWVYIKKQD